MPASPIDSAIYRDLFGDLEIAKLFSDSAEIRAMLLVEGALAKAQGTQGVIPEISAAAIHRAAMEVVIDPGGLSAETGRSAVVVPALIGAFREAMQAPEHAQYIHWGATSQDIMDTGLMLRLRQVGAIFEERLSSVLSASAALAETHADLPMAARTYGQAATATSFGAVACAWGAPLLGARGRLSGVRDGIGHVSLSGAAGTLSAMGDKGPKVRAALAEALNLRDPGGSWHSNRDVLASFAAWMTQACNALGKIGEDLLLLTQSGVAEVTLGASGGSSTMPQKQNPVQPSLLVALARHVTALNSAMQGAMLHRQQRDGAAWLTEWLTLPQICQCSGRALVVAREILQNLTPNPDAMAHGLNPDGLDLIYAEALSFALTASMPRPEAQAVVKRLCQTALETKTPLRELAAKEWPEVNLSAVFDPARQLGTAPSEARAFARAVRTA